MSLCPDMTIDGCPGYDREMFGKSCSGNVAELSDMLMGVREMGVDGCPRNASREMRVLMDVREMLGDCNE